MPNVQLKILHISDLHMNRKVDASLEGILCHIACTEALQVVIVSGDLANQPLPWQMKRAARFLERLQQAAGPNHTLILPGNHDYKFWGNFGLRRASRIFFHVFFRQNGLQMSRPGRWWRYFILFLNSLWRWGSLLRDPIEFRALDDLGLLLVGFNSNPLRERFTLATGKVDDADLGILACRLAELQSAGGHDLAFRVAAVHHHPLPIAHLPTGVRPRLFESFMILFNAEPFLRELATHDFHLVLHGHKHFAGFQRISYDSDSRGRRHLAVAAAGSATHPQPDDRRGHHFNLVEVLDDDTARLHSWFFSSASLRTDDTRVHDVRDLNDVRASRCEVLLRQKGLYVDEVRRTVRITNNGYSRVEQEWLNCRSVSPSGVDGSDFELDVHAPAYLRTPEPWRVAGSPPFVHFAPGAETRLDRFRGRLGFGRSFLPADPPFHFGFRCRLINSHALTSQEFARKYFGNAPPAEYAALQCMDACRRLTLEVEMPEGIDARSLQPDVEVGYMPRPLKALSDFDFEKLRTHAPESSRLRAEAEARRIILRCDNPVPGFIYRLRWHLPEASPLAAPPLAWQTRVLAGQRRLLELFERAAKGDAAARSRYARLREVLEALCRDLKPYLRAKPTETFSLALLVFDDATCKLRFVAATFSDPDRLEFETFAPGEGCAGYAFEKCRYLLYHPDRDEIGYYLRPAERHGSTSLEPQEFLITMPWVYPSGVSETSAIIVGVIAVGSQAVDSSLAFLFDLPEDKQRSVVGNIQGLITELANDILESE